MSQMNFLKTVIIVQLFYAVSITGLAHFIPADALNFVTSYQDLANDISLQDVSGEIQSSLQSQTNIPIVELGALVIYSGNILIDLFFNFMTATPQMIVLLIQSVSYLFSVNVVVLGLIQLFLTVIIGSLYMLGIISILTNVRSGRLV